MELKRGQIAVSKKALMEHCKVLSEAVKRIDSIMLEKESNERGKKIAQVMNAITFTNHAIQHFELNVPLKKLK